MINDIFSIRKRAKAARDHVESDLRKKEQRRMIPQLMTHSIDNVRYIRAYINTLRGNIHHMKGESAADTKRKREGARSQLNWLEGKLSEEICHANHYARLLGKTINL
jgi:hypothetical protein